MTRPVVRSFWQSCVIALVILCVSSSSFADPVRLAYLVSDLRIPFWNIMRGGIEARASALGYELSVFSAENDTKRELQNAVQALSSGIDGLILSPTNSSSAVTLLGLAEEAGVPVVIADIGTEAGTYVSYIESDNEQGAFELGRILVKTLNARGWSEGGVGIVSIPQSRENGRARTRGFIQALEGSGFDTAGIRQQVDFSYRETYALSRDLMAQHERLRAIWLQGSDRYQGALDAIRDAGREGDVLLICFDAEPEFIDMIRDGSLVAAGMQQPRLMGAKAVSALDDHLKGRVVPERQQVPVLAVSHDNLEQLLPRIRRNVLGLDVEGADAVSQP